MWRKIVTRPGLLSRFSLSMTAVFSSATRQVTNTVKLKATEATAQSPLNWVSPSHGSISGSETSPEAYPKTVPRPMMQLAYAFTCTCCSGWQQSTISALIPVCTGWITMLSAQTNADARTLMNIDADRVPVSRPKDDKMSLPVSVVRGRIARQIVVAMVPQMIKGLRRPQEL